MVKRWVADNSGGMADADAEKLEADFTALQVQHLVYLRLIDFCRVCCLGSRVQCFGVGEGGSVSRGLGFPRGWGFPGVRG